MSVYYKFNAASDYDTFPIDGLSINLADLKEEITRQKRLGKGVCNLKVTNEVTKEGKIKNKIDINYLLYIHKIVFFIVYTDERTLIPKNSSLIIERVPVDRSLNKLKKLG